MLLTHKVQHFKAELISLRGYHQFESFWVLDTFYPCSSFHCNLSPDTVLCYSRLDHPFIYHANTKIQSYIHTIYPDSTLRILRNKITPSLHLILLRPEVLDLLEKALETLLVEVLRPDVSEIVLC